VGFEKIYIGAEILDQSGYYEQSCTTLSLRFSAQEERIQILREEGRMLELRGEEDFLPTLINKSRGETFPEY
jgi:hypothetical protein